MKLRLHHPTKEKKKQTTLTLVDVGVHVGLHVQYPGAFGGQDGRQHDDRHQRAQHQQQQHLFQLGPGVPQGRAPGRVVPDVHRGTPRRLIDLDRPDAAAVLVRKLGLLVAGHLREGKETRQRQFR